MEWTQAITPLDNQQLSVFLAFIPISFLLFALYYARMKLHTASLGALILALGLAWGVHGMPLQLALWSSLYGALVGLFPLGWILLSSVFLYQLSVRSGQLKVMRDSITGLTRDQRLQCLVIALCLGSFLQGVAGSQVAIIVTAGLLVALGFKPIYAAVLCLIGTAASAAFGVSGLPIFTAAAVSGIDTMVISQMLGRQVILLSFFLPFWLVFVLAGWRGTREVWPAILLCGVSLAGTQWLTANLLHPALTNLVAPGVTLLLLMALLRKWQPQTQWQFPETRVQEEGMQVALSAILKAWAPYVFLAPFVLLWSWQPVQGLLGGVALKIPFTPLQNLQLATGKTLQVTYALNGLASVGTAIFLIALGTAYLYRISYRELKATFFSTWRSLLKPMGSIALLMGMVYVTSWSGMLGTLGQWLAGLGSIFPLLAPILGWLGMSVTGSEITTSALFGRLQVDTAQAVGLDPVLAVAANGSGVATAQMLAPHSISAAATSTGLAGREEDIFSYTLLHSLFFASIMCVLNYLQAYLGAWMIPVYTVTANIEQPVGGDQVLEGLLLLSVTIGLSWLMVRKHRRRKTSPGDKVYPTH